MKRLMKRLLALAMLGALLGGCAVYGDGDRGYYDADRHGDRYGGFHDHGS